MLFSHQLAAAFAVGSASALNWHPPSWPTDSPEPWTGIPSWPKPGKPWMGHGHYSSSETSTETCSEESSSASASHKTSKSSSFGTASLTISSSASSYSSVKTSLTGSSSSVYSSGIPSKSTSVSVSVVPSRSPSSVSSKKSSKVASSIASSLGSAIPTQTGGANYIDTTSGRLIGHPAPNTTGVTEYLGIPYAQPPLGSLRFAPPVAYTSNRIINASTFGADCPATLENVPPALGTRLYGLLGSVGQVNDTLDEDCLFVNVYTKTKPTSTKTPVLVWIYGGGFSFGGTSPVYYSGKHFPETEDVIFVSLNYRVNVLGFSGAPNTTQNVGLLDQRLAIEWVRDNIAAFGGDPERITIFGQSAGGASVDLYSYAWVDDPIVAGVIPMSGSANSFGSRTAAGAATEWYNVTTTLGCGNSSTSTDEAILECMRQPNITWQAIEAAAAPPAGLSSLLGYFGPTIDEKTVFSNYTDLAAKGNFIKKPTLTGNLNYESGLFILIAAGAGQGFPQSTWDYINLQIFTCPVSRIAEYAADAGVPTWRYYYSAMYPNLILPTSNISQAWHTSEVAVMFNTAAETSQTPNTVPETELGSYMRHAWATFAADPVNGLAGGEFGWPQYSSTGTNIVLLGQNNMTVAYGYSANITQGCAL